MQRCNRAMTYLLAQDVVPMCLSDDSIWMMLVLDLRMAGIASAVTSMTIAVAVMAIAFVNALNHPSMIYACVLPKIGH